MSPHVDSFLRRVELGVADGGFAMITGDPGTGKSVALRLLAERLRALPDVLVGSLEHPQSRTMDFYRELGDLFGVPFGAYNRWAGFKALRSRWAEHITSTRSRPVLIFDEAQETLATVFSELRTLASKDLDSKQLLCVVFAGDARLPSDFAHKISSLSDHESGVASRSTLPRATSSNLQKSLTVTQRP
jgi:general secretion pathway protein A